MTDNLAPVGVANHRPNRRNVLRYGVGVGLLAAGSPLLEACGSGGSQKGTLQVWTWASEFQASFAATIASYQKANPHVTVKTRYWDFATYGASLQAALSAGNEADIFMPSTSTLALGKAARVLELKTAFGRQFIDRFFDSCNSENVYERGQYAIPWAAQTFGIFYNKRILARAGVRPPETWDDLIAMAPVIRGKTGAIPMSIQGNPSNQLADFLMPLITQITRDPQMALDLDAHEKKGVSWNSAPMVQALSKVRAMQRAGVFDSGVLAVTSDTSNSVFLQGKAAMLFSGSFFPPALQTTAPKSFLHEYGIAKTPAWTKGGKHWCANQAGYTWSISSKSQNKAEAVKFLTYLYAPDRYLKMMNDTFSMPATKAAVAGVTSSDIKTMSSWLVDGEGAPHILFGRGSLDSVSNGVVSVINASATPRQAAAAIEAAVVHARNI